MEIRRLPSSEKAALYNLAQAAFDDQLSWSQEELNNMLNQDHMKFYVALEEGASLGFIGCSHILDEIEIYMIGIKKSYQNKGYGNKLINLFLPHMWKKNINKIYLEVRSLNKPALAIYKKNGFSQIGYRKNYYKEPTDDAVIMAINREELL